MGDIEYQVLGPLEVLVGGRPVTLGSNKHRALLSLLLIHANRVVPTDVLIDELWGERPPATARHALQVYVSALRKVLEPDRPAGVESVLVARPPGYVLSVAAESMDVGRFEASTAEARRALAAGDAAAAAPELATALALWRGRAFSDVTGVTAVEREAARLEELRIGALEDRIDADLQLGRHADVVPELDALAATHPLRERVAGLRMVALYRAGRQGDALEAYRALRTALRDELGLDPTAELRELEHWILVQDPALGGPSAVAPAEAAPAAPPIVALLFTDIVASTELLYRLGEDEAEERRRAHFRLLREEIEAHGGSEVKSLGDGVLAVFASAVAALDCGAAIQRAMERRRTWDQGGGAPIRIGIHAGEPIQDDDDYFGTPVVVAQRLCAAATGGTVLVSTTVRDLVGTRSRFSFDDAGELDLKGIPYPVHALTLRWEPAPERTVPLPPLLAGEVSTPFVGRDHELERLRTVLGLAGEGGRTLVLVEGDAGIGKTRLATEFARAAHEAGSIVLHGRCFEASAVPYQPFVEALRHAVEHTPGDLLRTEIGLLLPDLARLLPIVADRVPGLGPGGTGDPESDRLRLFDAVDRMLAGEGPPVVLVVDDIHWADEPTLVLLRHLLCAGAPARLLVIATQRAGEVPPASLVTMVSDIQRHARLERVAVGPLDEGDVSRMAAALSGTAVPESVVRAVHEEAEGNPFFVEELFRNIGESGGWHEDAGPALPLPDSVRSVIERRLTRLPAPVREVLDAASVLGREFTLADVHAVAAADMGGVLAALDEADRARLVHAVPGTPGRFSFSHALVHETIAAALTHARRLALHAHAVEALTASGADPAVIAHHARQAVGVVGVDRAVELLGVAGRHAMQALAYEEAVAHHRRALDLLGDRDADGGRRSRVLLELGEAQVALGRAAEAVDTYRMASDQARLAHDDETFARAAVGVETARTWNTLYWPGEGAEEVALMEEALERVGDADTLLRVQLLAHLTRPLFFLTYHAPSARLPEAAREAEDLAQRLGDPRALAEAAFAHLWAHRGEPAERQAEFGRLAVERAAALGDPRVGFVARWMHYRYLLELGAITEIDQALDELGGLVETWRMPYARSFVASLLAMRAILQGRFDAAEELSQRAVALSDGAPWGVQAFTCRQFLLRWEQGRLAEMEATAAAFASLHPSAAAAHAIVLAELGRHDGAGEILDELAVDGFAGCRTRVVPPGEGDAALVLAAEAAGRLGHAAHAALYDALLPFRGKLMPWSNLAVCLGAVDRHLGVLAAVAGRYDDALGHLDEALALHERIASPPWIAHTLVDRADVLRRRGRSGDAGAWNELLDRAGGIAAGLGMVALSRRIDVLRGAELSLS